MAAEPLFSIYMTPGVTFHQSMADLGGNKYVRFSNMQFMSKIRLFMEDSANWPADPLFVEIWKTHEEAGAKPLWWHMVSHQDGLQNVDNFEDFHQPLRGTQFDVGFRTGSAYPYGTVLTNGELITQEWSVEVCGWPPSLT